MNHFNLYFLIGHMFYLSSLFIEETFTALVVCFFGLIYVILAFLSFNFENKIIRFNSRMEHEKYKVLLDLIAQINDKLKEQNKKITKTRTKRKYRKHEN